ncbi:MAG: nucleoside-diphosphate kinase [Planctomycetota bacterium]|nr:MAG: nucleoside-diphosphate kinase [Planctomycetota bacterium]
MASKETTLIIVKPDGVQRGLIGNIISKFENRGLTLVGLKLEVVTKKLAENHYGEHKGKPFYNGLIKYITSGPVVLMAVQGENAVMACRKICGATNPIDAELGTIRGDYALTVSFNIVHSSDSVKSGKAEVKRFFATKELSKYNKIDSSWV